MATIQRILVEDEGTQFTLVVCTVDNDNYLCCYSDTEGHPVKRCYGPSFIIRRDRGRRFAYQFPGHYKRLMHDFRDTNGVDLEELWGGITIAAIVVDLITLDQAQQVLPDKMNIQETHETLAKTVWTSDEAQIGRTNKFFIVSSPQTPIITLDLNNSPFPKE